MIRSAARVLLVLLCGQTLWAAADVSAAWLDVPFVKQTKDGCGAASIAMVLEYWRREQHLPESDTADPARIERALYSGRRHAIYASDLEHYFERQGFRTFAFHGDWADLKQHLLKGRPLIVALKPISASPSLHYEVVVGMADGEQTVLLNDPAQRKLLRQSRSSFERQWSVTGKWTVLALPPPDAR
jgi:predicted double-glycine peptidase